MPLQNRQVDGSSKVEKTPVDEPKAAKVQAPQVKVADPVRDVAQDACQHKGGIIMVVNNAEQRSKAEQYLSEFRGRRRNIVKVVKGQEIHWRPE